MQDYETLYNSLSFNLPTDDLKDVEKLEMSNLVSKFNLEKKEIFYQLVLHDWTRYNPNTKVRYPYKMKQQNDDLEIKVDCLPIRVKRILLKFARLANKSETDQIKTELNELNKTQHTLI